MNQYIKNNFNKIINIFILLQPFLDLITGICVNTLNTSITIGIIIRILFLLFIMYTTTFIYKKRLSTTSYIILILYSIFFITGVIVYKDNVLFNELQGLLKAIYFPIILVSLYDLKDEYRVSKMTLFTTLIIYLIFILIPNALGIGYATYKITKAGSLGFFNSANEISGILSLLTPTMFIIIKDLKNKLLKVIIPIIYLIVILTIGTKTPLLVLFITIGFSFLYYIITCIKKKTYKPIFIASTTILVGICSLLLILPKTTFYKNIEVHLDYLEVDNILDIFKEKELIDHFIFSQRLTFLEHKAATYSEATLYENIFGIGYTNNKKVSKLIEMDYFDILYSHGIIGFLIVFTIYFIILYKLLREKQKLTFERYMVKVSIFLILLLSFFTGHIITSPAVSLISIILILETYKQEKKNLLFTAVNLKVGGIETSLINLLNNIDYEKYNVRVILEEKIGELLTKVNDNAEVDELKVSNNKNILIRKLINFSRKLQFTIFNYNNYDFSCCYATYSFSGNKLSLIASKNNSIYIHSNYKQLYKNENEFKEFFNNRKINEFRKIIFVSNESKEDFLKIYPKLKEKTEVINNFINIKNVKEQSKEKITFERKKNNTLFVFVGRLDDSSKKVKRAINIVKEIPNTELWIIGDGPDRKEYENYTKENNLEEKVTFFGKKLNPYPYMKEASYIILTSDYEGFPVIYLESIILNKPIITTIDVSDDAINIGKDYANIISKDETKMIKEIEKIIKTNKKTKTIDLNKVQINRIKKLEEIFDEVI